MRQIGPDGAPENPNKNNQINHAEQNLENDIPKSTTENAPPTSSDEKLLKVFHDAIKKIEKREEEIAFLNAKALVNKTAAVPAEQAKIDFRIWEGVVRWVGIAIAIGAIFAAGQKVELVNGQAYFPKEVIPLHEEFCKPVAPEPNERGRRYGCFLPDPL